MVTNKLGGVYVALWLFKDIFWCLQIKPLAIAIAIPTLALSVFSLAVDKENRKENLVLTAWVAMNGAWMMHELAEWPFVLTFLPMSLGAFFAISMIATRYFK